MKRGRKVKILATLGPSSSTEDIIGRLHNAGADAFRINMSHASHDVMRDLVKRIRAVEKSIGPADRYPGRSARTEIARRCLRR